MYFETLCQLISIVLLKLFYVMSVSFSLSVWYRLATCGSWFGITQITANNLESNDHLWGMKWQKSLKIIVIFQLSAGRYKLER